MRGPSAQTNACGDASTEAIGRSSRPQLCPADDLCKEVPLRLAPAARV